MTTARTLPSWHAWTSADSQGAPIPVVTIRSLIAILRIPRGSARSRRTRQEPEPLLHGDHLSGRRGPAHGRQDVTPGACRRDPRGSPVRPGLPAGGRGSETPPEPACAAA